MTDTDEFDGKVVFITGAGRGMGRNHAIEFARLGASVAVTDLAATPDDHIGLDTARHDDLEETADLVRAAGGKCVAVYADVRKRAEVAAAVDQAVSELGRLDILVANAGIAHLQAFGELSEQQWHDVIDVNLHGTVNAIHSALPHMVDGGFGRVICIGSMRGKMGAVRSSSYVASKWALHGLVKCIALEYGPVGITANVVNPTLVNTPMGINDLTIKQVCPDIENPTLDDAIVRFTAANAIPVPWIEASDITAAVLFLASEQARYITGGSIDVGAGANAKFTG